MGTLPYLEFVPLEEALMARELYTPIDVNNLIVGKAVPQRAAFVLVEMKRGLGVPFQFWDFMYGREPRWSV